jgi:Arc/MetJ-type ribon-helix-helix transcriptional regulator
MQKVRLQFDFTPEAVAEIDTLVSVGGFSTRAELIRHALRFMQWALEETKKDGATLLLEKDDRMREVVFPFWAPVSTVARETAKEVSSARSQKATAVA